MANLLLDVMLKMFIIIQYFDEVNKEILLLIFSRITRYVM